MRPRPRKISLVVHLVSSIGWVGAVLGYIGLGVASVTANEPRTIRAAWVGMEVTGWWVILPLAASALASGIVIALGTPWGLFRHYWVVISLALTLFANAILIQHMPTVSRMAEIARVTPDAELTAMGGDLFHAVAGLLILLAVTVLNVFKPQGLTPYGWRKQEEERARRRAAA